MENNRVAVRVKKPYLSSQNGEIETVLLISAEQIRVDETAFIEHIF